MPRSPLHRLAARFAVISILSSAIASCSPPAGAPPVQQGTGPKSDGAAQAPSAAPPPEAPDRAFADLSARFLEGYLAREPVAATEAGEHRHDARWPDRTAEGEAEARRFYAQTLAELERIPQSALDPQARVDHAMLGSQLRYSLFAIDELRDAQTTPLYYTRLVGDGIDPLVNRNFGTREERMKSLRGRLEGIPAVLAAAKKRLGRPPRLHTETAIAQNRGLVNLCRGDLPKRDPSLASAAGRAAAALEDFQAFLERDLLPRSDGELRLGRERFTKKLGFYLDDDIDPEAVARGARELLVRTQAEMADTAREIWPKVLPEKKMPKATTPEEKKVFVRQVLDALASDHPTNETIVAEAKDLVARATVFVREHDLVRVPEEPCGVIEMPEYRRGVAVAYCDTSGPLEQKPEAFYAISPTPADWDEKRKLSFYREYNRSMLADLTVHEAMPGHFLQLMHNNRFPSKLRAVFSSGPFVEGWAVYSEWLLAKYGFGGPKVRLQRQKMVLRLAVNALLDHGVHAGTMTEAEGHALMMNEAFQEEGEAVGKWRRALLTSAQLTTYYYGFTEMMKLRAANEGKPGFSERAYHDKILGFGSPSMRHLRALVNP
ncbi:DUF885 domain-containing protein [Polyangium aurulentum]|uniref:DUF885 domain-containing protein n=1 Tax=Polyangium aurulentum TaxID=2567896 RepID=UPI0010AE9098|nr:DUF885 domain-containing protein [Polyangium aurulentum]UQA63415.1 DUF885 domain-containing protein [Polyangium aurulentum]